ncbi:MAG: alpha/beta hydrolase [Promicromonosporaceae bacterium]|nr:alpha/beta hydrolase [Promicromonosporaceae bacterium]
MSKRSLLISLLALAFLGGVTLSVVALVTGGGGTGDAVARPTATAAPTAPAATPTREPSPPPPADRPSTSIPEGFEDFYTQTITWEPCGSGLYCATILAPLSWSDPGAGSIDLALNLLPAVGQRQGAVLTNPGGPGGSGISFLEMAAGAGIFGSHLRDAFDVVGFDPRGVGQSTPIVCLDDAPKEAALARDFSADEDGLQAAREATAAWAAACYENSGAIFGNVDTQSAARDMDLIRALLGEERLDFLGFSYGTLLGATYATLFPQYVGAFVLDGAIDVTLTTDESTVQQAAGFELALTNYVTDCLAGASCPLTGTVEEGLAQIGAMLEDALENPLPTSSGREVTQTLAFYGVAVTLYDEGSWPFLSLALDEVFSSGTGDLLLFLADFYFDREPDGTFSTNSIEAFRAVNCLDSWGNADMDFMLANLELLDSVAPTMGWFFGFGGLACYGWPFDPVAALVWGPVATEQPIVIIGTTGDPATPYEGAHALARTLGNAVVITFEGEGHTAYGRSNDCIVDAVDAFFVDGVVPTNGLTC